MHYHLLKYPYAGCKTPIQQTNSNPLVIAEAIAQMQADGKTSWSFQVRKVSEDKPSRDDLNTGEIIASIFFGSTTWRAYIKDDAFQKAVDQIGGLGLDFATQHGKDDIPFV